MTWTVMRRCWRNRAGLRKPLGRIQRGFSGSPAMIKDAITDEKTPASLPGSLVLPLETN